LKYFGPLVFVVESTAFPNWWCWLTWCR